jgi:tetratricopeptide (TPR) repeat protein
MSTLPVRFLAFVCLFALVSQAPAQTAKAREHVAAGNKLYAAREFKKALAEYEKAIEADSRYAAAHLFRGKTLTVLGEPLPAARALKRAMEFGDREVKAYALFHLGEIFEGFIKEQGAKARAEALAAYQEAAWLTTDPRFEKHIQTAIDRLSK